MNRLFLLALSATLEVGTTQAKAQTDSGFIQAVRYASTAVLLVETFDEQGRPLGSGTGFIVDSIGTFVTNHHVMAGAVTARALTHNRESFPVAGWTSVNQEADLILLRMRVSSATPWLRLGGTAAPEPGTELVVIGAPRGLAQTVTSGLSSGLQEREGRRVLQLSALASPGSSGSPVIDRSAVVRGVVAAGRSDAPQVVYAVPVSELNTLVAAQDSTKALGTLPGTLTTRLRRPDDPYAPPLGLTGMYQFQTLVGYPFAYVWLVEAPSGALSGAAFIQHATGFVDVAPLQIGVRPGRRRGFEFQAGCGLFEGWIRDEGVLAGDVSNTCKGGSAAPFLAVPLGWASADRSRRRQIRLYLARLQPSPPPKTAWAWVVAVTPKDLGEGTVGSMHMWGDIPGRPGRLDLVFGRGRSDSTSLTLETTDQAIQLALTESGGTITGQLVTPTDSSQQVGLEGYRSDLAYCFDRARIKASTDSTLGSLAAQGAKIDDSLSALTRVLNSPALANPRSGPLASSATGVPDEKEKARLARRAPLDSAVATLSGRRHANARLRTTLTERLTSLTLCPSLQKQ